MSPGTEVSACSIAFLLLTPLRAVVTLGGRRAMAHVHCPSCVHMTHAPTSEGTKDSGRARGERGGTQAIAWRTGLSCVPRPTTGSVEGGAPQQGPRDLPEARQVHGQTRDRDGASLFRSKLGKEGPPHTRATMLSSETSPAPSLAVLVVVSADIAEVSSKRLHGQGAGNLATPPLDDDPCGEGRTGLVSNTFPHHLQRPGCPVPPPPCSR